jgi:hypothetical protein
MAEEKYKIRSATSRSRVKQIALQYAQDTRHQPFTRVGASFLDDIEAQTMALIRRKVDAHPSKGVTLT